MLQDRGSCSGHMLQDITPGQPDLSRDLEHEGTEFGKQGMILPAVARVQWNLIPPEVPMVAKEDGDTHIVMCELTSEVEDLPLIHEGEE